MELLAAPISVFSLLNEPWNCVTMWAAMTWSVIGKNQFSCGQQDSDKSRKQWHGMYNHDSVEGQRLPKKAKIQQQKQLQAQITDSHTQMKKLWWCGQEKGQERSFVGNSCLSTTSAWAPIQYEEGGIFAGILWYFGIYTHSLPYYIRMRSEDQYHSHVCNIKI